MRKTEIINEINKAKEQKRHIVAEMEKKEYILGHKLRGQAKHYYNLRLEHCNRLIQYGRNKLLENIGRI